MYEVQDLSVCHPTTFKLQWEGDGWEGGGVLGVWIGEVFPLYTNIQIDTHLLFYFSALVTAYEKAKKKHQSRLKKLEAQMIAMVERHDTQVRQRDIILYTT